MSQCRVLTITSIAQSCLLYITVGTSPEASEGKGIVKQEGRGKAAYCLSSELSYGLMHLRNRIG